jgi:hypothetical protein
MGLRGWSLLALLLCALGWWHSPWSPRVPKAPVAAAGENPACPPPFRLQAATLTPLAGFSIEARVLSREDYAMGREAQLSPTDLALGWQRMRDDDILSRLDISQSSRWYRYRWQGDPPLPPQDIIRSSANMHMIPFDQATAAALGKVRAGDRVRIDGWLVQAEAPDGWRWRSSTTRDDTGGGACELVYVCAISPLPAL